MKIWPKYVWIIKNQTISRQFSAEKWEETLPATTYVIEKYLGSGLTKGVGPKFAKRIVQQFGKDTLEIIEIYIYRSKAS